MSQVYSCPNLSSSTRPAWFAGSENLADICHNSPVDRGARFFGTLTFSYDADRRVTGKNGRLAASGLPASVSGNTFNADNGIAAFGGASSHTPARDA